MSLISVKNLRLGYEGRAINGELSFDVNEGDFLCILGENGSGKTTLLKTMLGINRAHGGSVEFALRGARVGYLPQYTGAQKDFPASVREVVTSGCLSRAGLRPFYNAKDRALAREAMEAMSIAGLSAMRFSELSGGQQRRVLLARAVCAAGSALFLDEPAAGLDSGVTRDMYELVSGLNRERALTVVMVTHDEGDARYASHILRLGGESAFFGTAGEYSGKAEGSRGKGERK